MQASLLTGKQISYGALWKFKGIYNYLNWSSNPHVLPFMLFNKHITIKISCCILAHFRMYSDIDSIWRMLYYFTKIKKVASFLQDVNEKIHKNQKVNVLRSYEYSLLFAHV